MKFFSFSLLPKLLIWMMLCASVTTLSAHEPIDDENGPEITLSAEKGEGKQGALKGHVFDLQEKLPIQTPVAIRLRDAWGQLQAEKEVVLERGAGKVYLSLEAVGQGVYFIELETEWEKQSDMVVID
ncbi:MAG: hypothetical protein AAFV07_02555 [Bacteroidota bacterium]